MPAEISRRDAGSVHTFSTIAAPGVHYQRARCTEVGCDGFVQGFKVRVNETEFEGQKWAHFIRYTVTRRDWTETKDESGLLTVFTFPPGGSCFRDGHDHQAHRVLGVAAHVRRVAPQLHVVSTGDAVRVAAQINRDMELGRQPRLQDQRIVTDGSAWARELAERWNAQQPLAQQMRGN